MMVKGDVRDRPEDRPVQVGASEHCLQEEKKKNLCISVYIVYFSIQCIYRRFRCLEMNYQ